MHVEKTAEEAGRRGARMIARAARATVAHRGDFALAVSGGEAPWLMFAKLAEEEMPWSETMIFQVDERIAPQGDPDRNLTHLEETFPPEALERLRPMPVDDEDLEGAADRYAAGLPEAIDLVHLGIGPDGHTASLVPDDPVLEITDRAVALTAGEYEGRRRMTLTYPALAAASAILWLVTGEDKRDPLAKLRAADPSIPAGRVEQAEAAVVADRAAAG